MTVKVSYLELSREAIKLIRTMSVQPNPSSFLLSRHPLRIAHADHTNTLQHPSTHSRCPRTTSIYVLVITVLVQMTER